jgi:hypothetical protein
VAPDVPIDGESFIVHPPYAVTTYGGRVGNGVGQCLLADAKLTKNRSQELITGHFPRDFAQGALRLA